MDLNMMMREQALAGFNRELDAAVTNGDAEAARVVVKKIADLTAAVQPAKPPYGDTEIKAELNKLDWFGVDPKKSGRALALGKDMNIAKFATAEAFAAALVKAVESEAEFKPPVAAKAPPENETDEEREEREAEEAEAAETAAAAKKAKIRATDGPGEGDTLNNRGTRVARGPWTKLSDAPADVQKEVKRSADKYVPASATKEQREQFITTALGSHYQRSKAGKK